MSLPKIRKAVVYLFALCCSWPGASALSLEIKKDMPAADPQRMTMLQRKAKVSPKHSPTIGALGLMEANLKHFPLAITYYDRAIELHEQELKDPANNFVAREIVTRALAAAFRQRGHCFLDEQKYDRSLVDFNRSLQYFPHDQGTYELRASAYRALGKNDLALESERKSKEMSKWTALEKKYREAMKTAIGQFGVCSIESAVRSCDEAIKTLPDWSEAHLWRARNLRMLGKLSLSSDEYDWLLKLHPTDKNLQAERQSMKSLAGESGHVTKPSEAITIEEEQAASALGTESANLASLPQIEEFQKRYPYNHFGVWAHAERTAGDKNFAVTRADYNKLMLLEPWEPEVYVRRADCEHAMHLWNPAIADYTAWLSKAPSCIDWQWAQGSWTRYKLTFLSRADCLKHIGQFKKAADDCTLAITLDPDEGAIYQKRAEVFFAQQDFSKAVADYNSAIELDGEPTASNLLGRSRAYEKLGEQGLALKDRELAKKLSSSKALNF